MSISNSEVSFLVDTMIVETLLSDNSELSKTAQAGGLLSSLVSKVHEYVGNHIRPDDKVGSLMDILGPGMITITLRALGFGWLGWLVGMAMSVFHINISDIVKSVWDKLKGSLGTNGENKITSAHVDNAVSAAIQEHDKPMTEEEAEQAKVQLDKQKEANQRLRDAQLLKLALVQLKKDNEFFIRRALNAGIAPQLVVSAGLLDILSPRKKAITSLLGTILGWVLKIGLAAAGLMVAGDVVNKMIGRPNAIDGSMKDGKTIDQPQQAISAPEPKQTKFKLNPSYNDQKHNQGNDRWVESIPNTESSIENLLIMYAQEVYSGLEGKEAYIRNTPGLQAIKDRIVMYNISSQGDNLVFIPRYFTSKKQIVDMFIDDVAKNVPNTPQ